MVNLFAFLNLFGSQKIGLVFLLDFGMPGQKLILFQLVLLTYYRYLGGVYMLFSKRGKSLHQNFTKLRKLSPRKYCAWWNWHIQRCRFHSEQNTIESWQLSLRGVVYFNKTHHMWCINKCKMGNRNICPFCQIYQWWFIFIWKNDSSQLHWLFLFFPYGNDYLFCCFSYQLLLWFKILNHILFLRNVKSGLCSAAKRHAPLLHFVNPSILEK